LRFVHPDRPTIDRGAIHFLNGGIRTARIRESDEPEPTGSTCLTIENHLRLSDLTKALESTLESRVVGVPTQPADKEFVAHFVFNFSWVDPTVCLPGHVPVWVVPARGLG
jgi:hypothetical protein